MLLWQTANMSCSAMSSGFCAVGMLLWQVAKPVLRAAFARACPAPPPLPTLIALDPVSPLPCSSRHLPAPPACPSPLKTAPFQPAPAASGQQQPAGTNRKDRQGASRCAQRGPSFPHRGDRILPPIPWRPLSPRALFLPGPSSTRPTRMYLPVPDCPIPASPRGLRQATTGGDEPERPARFGPLRPARAEPPPSRTLHSPTYAVVPAFALPPPADRSLFPTPAFIVGSGFRLCRSICRLREMSLSGTPGPALRRRDLCPAPRFTPLCLNFEIPCKEPAR